MFLMVSHIVLSFLCCSLKLGTYCSFSRLPAAVAFILTKFHIFVAVVKAEVVLYGDLSLLQRSQLQKRWDITAVDSGC
jgi:hypothetical protein